MVNSSLRAVLTEQAQKQDALARHLQGVAEHYTLKHADVVKSALDQAAIEIFKELGQAVVTASDAARESATSLEGALPLIDD